MSASLAAEERPSLLGRLWPNTLGKFWGLHAVAFAVAAAALSALTRSSLPLPLAGANAVLGALLYRSQEDAGTVLAALAGVYFAAHAALLWSSPAALASLVTQAAPPMTARTLTLFVRLRLWCSALAVGGFVFSLKAALKDRLFDNQDGSMRRVVTGAPPAANGTAAANAAAAPLPTLALINKQAGAKIGARVGVALDAAAADARAAGRELRVVDLSVTQPEEALQAFGAEHAAFTVLVCGGDGSAAWVLGAIERAGLKGWDGAPYRPAVALLPLGTGNDLARVLGWGKGVRLDALRRRLASLDCTRVAMLDRWRLKGSLPEGKSSVLMCNYLSIGVDAKAALLWARLAVRLPWAFRLRLLNKLWYIICGSPEFALHSYRDLHERMEVTCDGKVIEIPKGIEGLMILNTPSYGGGSDLWDEARGAPLAARTDRFRTPPLRPSSMSDGVLELVGVTDVVHLAFSLGGLSNGVRLCQGSSFSVRSTGGVPLQIDGEPCNLTPAGPDGSEPFEFAISREDQVYVLGRSADTPVGGGVTAFAAVEGQLAKKAISTSQRDELLRTLGGGA